MEMLRRKKNNTEAIPSNYNLIFLRGGGGDHQGYRNCNPSFHLHVDPDPTPYKVMTPF
jgi:hypothetical protein